MGFDISNLGSYVQNNSKDYAMKSIASAKTAKALIDSKNVQFGVKGSAAILKLNSDVSFVSSANCGRTGGSSIALSNKNIVVRPIADEANLCPATLWNTFYANSVAQGQAPAEELVPAFATAIMDERAMKIAAVNEKLLWQGVYGSTGVTANYRMIDGIGTQVTGSTTATGSTIVEKLQNFFMNNDVDVRDQDDFHVFIGSDKYAEYKIAMAAKNIFQATDDMTVFGTTAKFFVTSGLNGVGKVYGMRLSNLQLGLDGEGDADKAELRYSTETKQWYQDFNFALGVAVIWSDEAKYATV
jgi:hypothetical protein